MNCCRAPGRRRTAQPVRCGQTDIIVVAPYNAQVNALRDALPDGIRVGTVDKFQGQEAPVCLVSMTASSAEETSRGMEFLFSLNRINVAVSRAKGLSLVFGAPRLREAKCETVEQMRLVNTLCAMLSHVPSQAASLERVLNFMDDQSYESGGTDPTITFTTRQVWPRRT